MKLIHNVKSQGIKCYTLGRLKKVNKARIICKNTLARFM